MHIYTFVGYCFSGSFWSSVMRRGMGVLRGFTKSMRNIAVVVCGVVGSILLSCYPGIEEDKTSIEVREQAGNYAQALVIARKSQEKLKKNSSGKLVNLSRIIARLEDKLLYCGYSELFFNKDGKPKAKLCQLLELIGMKHPWKKSIEEINTWAQANLLRKGERWHQQTDQFEPLRKEALPLLTDLGFVKGQSAHLHQYTGAIVHGGLISGVRLRLYNLIEQWNQGIRFAHLYFLSGERPLESVYEKDKLTEDSESCLKIRKGWKLVNLPKTECEMIQMVWDQSEVPEAMKQQVRVHFINVPMKREGTLYSRPTTGDTVEAWLQTAPPIGNYLVVSNIPYIVRQDVVIRTIAPVAYGFDTIGPAASFASQEVQMAIFCDELARLIFTLCKTKK